MSDEPPLGTTPSGISYLPRIKCNLILTILLTRNQNRNTETNMVAIMHRLGIPRFVRRPYLPIHKKHTFTELDNRQHRTEIRNSILLPFKSRIKTILKLTLEIPNINKAQLRRHTHRQNLQTKQTLLLLLRIFTTMYIQAIRTRSFALSPSVAYR